MICTLRRREAEKVGKKQEELESSLFHLHLLPSFSILERVVLVVVVFFLCFLLDLIGGFSFFSVEEADREGAEVGLKRDLKWYGFRSFDRLI